MKAGSHRSKLPLKKATEGDEEEIQEVTASIAAANEVNVDVAAVAALLEFHIKRRTALNFFHFAPERLWRDFKTLRGR